MNGIRRIALIVTQMEAGGAQGAMIRMAGELRARGFHVESWFLYRKRPAFDDQEGVRVMLDTKPRSLADLFRVTWRLFRALRVYRPDAIITFTHYANLLGSSLGLLSGCPRRIASQRRLPSRLPRGVRMVDMLMGMIGVYQKNILVSNAVAEELKRYPRRYLDRTRVIPNGVSFIPSSLKRDEARRRWNLPGQGALAVTTGRLAETKNHATLIHALVDLPDLSLAIAGEGELRPDLEALIGELGLDDRVHLLGELPPSEVPDLLAAADLFVFPSLWESFGFAMLEAVHAGLPIVASDIPAAREVLDSGNQGEAAAVFCDPRDPKEIARALRIVLNGSKCVREGLRIGRNHALHRFTFERMVDGYQETVLESGR